MASMGLMEVILLLLVLSMLMLDHPRLKFQGLAWRFEWQLFAKEGVCNGQSWRETVVERRVSYNLKPKAPRHLEESGSFESSY